MIIKLLYLFALGSIIGWVLELFFRTSVHRKLINPGALIGPYLPLHGTGFVLIYYISILDISILSKALLFLIATTLIELVIGKYFLDVWHVRYWDYSKNKWNYQGLICPLFSIIWVILSLLFYFYIFPNLQSNLNTLIFNNTYILILDIFYLFFSLDALFLIKRLNKKARN
jgi:uncharacterized membrane protein